MKNNQMKKTLSLVLTCGMLIPTTSALISPTVVEAASQQRLNHTTLNLSVGQTEKLSVSNSLKTTFSSSNEAVVSVSKDGTVKALKNGIAAITVKADGKKFYCKVKITDSINELTLNKSVLNLRLGGREKLVAIANPATASQKFIWTSSNSKVANVGNAGLVLGKRNGTATVTVKSAIDESKKATCTVNVGTNGINTSKPSKSVLITGKPSSFKVGKIYQLNATVFPLTASNKDVVWSSSDPNIASIDSSGKLHVLKVGKVTIKCTAKDGYSYSSFTFSANAGGINPDEGVLVNTIKISGDYIGLKVGDKTTLKATVNSDATNKNVIWSTNTPDIIQIDEKGNVSCIGEGTATVICESEDKGCKASLTFTVGNKSNEVFVTNIRVPELEKEIKVGDKVQLKAQISPSNATNKEVSWKSSDDNIATVSETGLLYVKKAGTFKITVTAKDGSGTQTVYTLKVINDTSEEILTEELDIQGMPKDYAVGDKIQLTAKISPSNATNKNVTWESNNEKVATINSSGLMTLVGTGEVTITCKAVDGGSGQTIRFTVTKTDHSIKVQKISMSGIPEYTYVDDVYTIKTTITPSNATNKTLEWSSSDNSIATVDQNGKVTALREGTVKITAKATDGSTASTNAIITVNKKPDKTIYATAVNLERVNPDDIPSVGGTLQLKATLSPSNVTNKNITWKSSDDSIATVDQNGKVTALKEGKVRITATSGDKRAASYVDITIRRDEPENIKITSIEFTNAPTTPPTVGDRFKLEYTIAPSNATNKNVIWTTSNERVATVDQSGNVEVVGHGRVTITCKAEVGTASKSMTFTTKSQSTEVDDIILSGFPTRFDASIIGKEYQLNAVVKPETLSQEVVWHSTNPDVATVSSTGLLRIIGFGEVEIECSTKDGSYTKIQPLKIENKVQKLTIQEPTQEFFKGDSYQFGIAFTPEDATNTAGTWSVDNEEIATISQDGVLNCKKAGKITIKYTLNDGSGFASATLTIQNSKVVEDNANPITNIKILGLEAKNRLYVGETYNLSASVDPENATNKEVAWVSKNPEVAVIDENGNLTILKEGTVNITCQSKTYVQMEDGSYSPTAATTIMKQAIVKPESGGSEPEEPEFKFIEKITLDSVTSPLVGKKYNMRVTISPLDATNQNLEWRSSNPKVLSVDENGNITAHNYGRAVIFCTAKDGSNVSVRRSYKVQNPMTKLDVSKPSSLTPNVPCKLIVTPTFYSISSIHDDEYEFTYEVTDKKGNPTNVATIDENGNFTLLERFGEPVKIIVKCNNNTIYRLDDDIETVYQFIPVTGEWSEISRISYNPQ